MVFISSDRSRIGAQMNAVRLHTECCMDDLAEITGNIIPSIRESLWKSKRFLFVSPQTLHNDLINGCCRGSDIVLLVVDRAHEIVNSGTLSQSIAEFKKHQSIVHCRLVAFSSVIPRCRTDLQTMIYSMQLSTIVQGDKGQSKTCDFDLQAKIVPLSDHILEVERNVMKIVSDYLVEIYNISGKQFAAERVTRNLVETWRNICRKELSVNISLVRLEQIFSLINDLLKSIEILHQNGLLSFVALFSSDSSTRFCVSKPVKSELLALQPFNELISMVRRVQCNDGFASHPKIINIASELRSKFKTNPGFVALVIVPSATIADETVKYLNRYHATEIRTISSCSGKSGSNRIRKPINQVSTDYIYVFPINRLWKG